MFLLVPYHCHCHFYYAYDNYHRYYDDDGYCYAL